MVNKCCAPNCRGNYKSGPRVSAFKFPSDPELRQKWLDSLKREDYKVSKHSVVCELHFNPHDIIRDEVVYDEKKDITYVNKFDRPKLMEKAIPCLVPNDSTISPNVKKPRENVFKRVAIRKDLFQVDLATYEKSKDNALFANFEEFQKRVKKNENLFTKDDSWNIKYAEKEVIFMNFEFHPVPKIRCSAIVDEKCCFRAFDDVLELKKIDSIELPEILVDIRRLDFILRRLLSLYGEKSSPQKNTSFYVDVVFDDSEKEDKTPKQLRFQNEEREGGRHTFDNVEGIRIHLLRRKIAQKKN